MYKFVAIAILAFSASGIAFADGDKDHSWTPSWWHHHPVSAPEIDPASALSGLTLLVGGLAVVRGRRKK